MVREVFENMTTTSHTPVKFLYDGVFDMLSIMLDDMPTDPKDAEEIRMLACGCDIVYDEFHLSDKDQEDGDEDWEGKVFLFLWVFIILSKICPYGFDDLCLW